MKKLFTLLFVFLIVFSFQSSGQILIEEFDQLMHEVFEADGPGGVALIVKDGKTIYRKAFGMANLELGVNMTPDHIFRIGSITKQFTACAILKLYEEGKLNLDDDITKYIIDYPTLGHNITIEHLLTHTSGIKSFTEMKEWTVEVKKKDFNPMELIDFFKYQPMDFAPGEEYRYNDSGYFILGYIIEIISGKTYAEYINDNFFEPLGMENSFYGSTSRIIKNRAYGYGRDGDEYKNADFLSMTQPYAAGSLISTVDDLYKWYLSVMRYKVVSQSSLEMAHRSYTLKSGKKTDYGYGWSIGNIQGSPMISHGGGINGYLTASLFLPEEKLFVAVFSNCDCNPVAGSANKMAALVINKPYEWNEISISDEILKSYVAVYSSEYDGDKIITFQEGNLYSMRPGGSRTEIFPYDVDKFFIKDSFVTIHFSRNTDGIVSSIIYKSTGIDIEWTRTNKPVPKFNEIKLDDALLKKYVGRYQLTPDFQVEIFQEENKMYTRGTGQNKLEIIAFEKHKFSLIEVDAQITFNLDENGIVNSLTLYQNGEYEAKKIE